MLLSTAIGGVSMALTTNPLKIPKYRDGWQWLLNKTMGTPKPGQLFKPLGTNVLPDEPPLGGNLPEELVGSDSLEDE